RGPLRDGPRGGPAELPAGRLRRLVDPGPRRRVARRHQHGLGAAAPLLDLLSRPPRARPRAPDLRGCRGGRGVRRGRAAGMDRPGAAPVDGGPRPLTHVRPHRARTTPVRVHTILAMYRRTSLYIARIVSGDGPV